ncbi:MAG: hypothetical protein K2W80_16730 [Burkholderiales bacterium]|nr:hypothetical protein [Burkholderiales bacterium]
MFGPLQPTRRVAPTPKTVAADPWRRVENIAKPLWIIAFRIARTLRTLVVIVVTSNFDRLLAGVLLKARAYFGLHPEAADCPISLSAFPSAATPKGHK